MQAGIIGVPVAGRLSTVESEHTTREEYGETLSTAVVVSNQQTLSGETTYAEGAAFRDNLEKREEWSVETEPANGNASAGGLVLRKPETYQRVQKQGGFVVVPAAEDGSHDGFVLVESSRATFIFDVLAMQTGIPIERPHIDLGAFSQANSLLAESAGTSAKTGAVRTVIAYGEDVFEDRDIGDALKDARVTDTLNPLSGWYTSKAMGTSVRANLAATGYVELWEPEVDTFEFLQWVAEDVLPHAEVRDDE